MRFFMTKHYSTAQKIINRAQQKLIRDLEALPRKNISIRLFTEDSYLYRPDDFYEYHFYGERNLVEVLGNALKASVSDITYAVYQRLHQTQKDELQETIAISYYELIKNETDNLRNLRTRTYKEQITRATGFESFVELTLPQCFHNPQWISEKLSAAILSFKEFLEQPENILHAQENDERCCTSCNIM